MKMNLIATLAIGRAAAFVAPHTKRAHYLAPLHGFPVPRRGAGVVGSPRRRRITGLRTQALGPARLHGALPAVVTRTIKKGRVAALLGLEFR